LYHYSQNSSWYFRSNTNRKAYNNIAEWWDKTTL